MNFLDERAPETVYEEINESSLDADESMDDSSWNGEIYETSFNSNDVINYYIQPVNEYENTVLILYENYMESQGYQDPVCEKEKCKEKQKSTDSNDDNSDDYDDDDADDGHNDDDEDDNDGYEIPETTLTYDILSNSPVELFLFVECLEPK